MRETKTVCKWFDITMEDQEAEYLRKMHKQGWKFVKYTTPVFYKFEKCEPEDVVYQLDYNKEACEHKSEYLQIFADCGWEYVDDVMGYTYFRKPLKEMDGEEKIFSDDLSELEMIERVYKGRMIPLLVIFLCIICPQLIIQSRSNYVGNTVLLVVYIVLFLVYLLLFYRFGKRYKELKERCR